MFEARKLRKQQAETAYNNELKNVPQDVLEDAKKSTERDILSHKANAASWATYGDVENTAAHLALSDISVWRGRRILARAYDKQARNQLTAAINSDKPKLASRLVDGSDKSRGEARLLRKQRQLQQDQNKEAKKQASQQRESAAADEIVEDPPPSIRAGTPGASVTVFPGDEPPSITPGISDIATESLNTSNELFSSPDRNRKRGKRF